MFILDIWFSIAIATANSSTNDIYKNIHFSNNFGIKGSDSTFW